MWNRIVHSYHCKAYARWAHYHLQFHALHKFQTPVHHHRSKRYTPTQDRRRYVDIVKINELQQDKLFENVRSKVCVCNEYMYNLVYEYVLFCTRIRVCTFHMDIHRKSAILYHASHVCVPYSQFHSTHLTVIISCIYYSKTMYVLSKLYL